RRQRCGVGEGEPVQPGRGAVGDGAVDRELQQPRLDELRAREDAQKTERDQKQPLLRSDPAEKPPQQPRVVHLAEGPVLLLGPAAGGGPRGDGGGRARPAGRSHHAFSSWSSSCWRRLIRAYSPSATARSSGRPASTARPSSRTITRSTAATADRRLAATR